MKISLKWLKNYIDVQEFFEAPEILGKKLTEAGLEVESITDRASPFKNVVIGHILERNQHPNADRLTLCQVQTGAGVVHSIVCGAKNHKAGDKVVVALPGAVLPGNFAIKRSKIRDVESEGMLCSEAELGLAKEAEGIMILPADSQIGRSFADFMGFDDILLEIKVTPNRADVLSHFGLAREISTLTGKEFTLPFKAFSEVSDSTKQKIKLSVQDSERCPRYAGRYIGSVKVSPSPAWLKNSLEAIGIKSINNIVDVTNFVMMELGQPLHAFDVRELKGSEIRVEAARAQEKFKTLDGSELTLDGSELTIRDSERVVALAGVVGGLNSGIKDDTKDIFVESAFFRSSTVRKTSRKFGFETDSSYRFSRGVDPDAAVLALNRACELIQQVAGGKIFTDHYDVYPNPIKKTVIEISISCVSERLGKSVDLNQFMKSMESLGCQVTSEGALIKVTPPLYRSDLQQDVDLVEEFARLTGYDQIPETLPKSHAAPLQDNTQVILLNSLAENLKGMGYSEAINFAFESKKDSSQVHETEIYKAQFGLNNGKAPVTIQNPLNEDLSVMRVSLLPGLLKNTSHNCRYGNAMGRVFESGYCFEKVENGFREPLRLGFSAWGQAVGLWGQGSKGSAPVVMELKTAVESLLSRLKVKSFRWVSVQEAPSLFHPGQVTCLQVEGKSVGVLGALHPEKCDELNIPVQCALAEFDLDKLFEGQPRLTKFKKISSFPAVERDLAFVVPKDMSSAQVMQVIQKASGSKLVSLRVFDIFEGGSLPSDQRSIAFRMVFQDFENTMTDEEIGKIQQTVIDSVGRGLGVRVR